MNKTEYKKFQNFQNQLFIFVDSEVDADTVFGNELLRLKQITGIADLFKDKEFSEAWSKE